MKKERLVKTLALGVVFLFICASAVSALNVNSANESKPLSGGNWFYVGGSGPGNYSNIQDAIDNASNGDTVFVYNGVYDLDFMIDVNKSIGLIGENKFNTIINDGGFLVNVSNVSISGFTIQNGLGIMILSDFYNPSGNNNIFDNIFKLESDDYLSGWGGVSIAGSYNNVYDNSFFNCGILTFSYQNYIYNNTVNGKPLVYLENTSDIVVDDAGQVILMGCDNISIKNLQLLNTFIGIQLLDSNNCFISNNELMGNLFAGIILLNSSNNMISGNELIDNLLCGIILFNSSNNMISDNLIFNNSAGLALVFSSCNTISKNSFENSTSNLFFENSTCNNISYNNFRYSFIKRNAFSLYSNNNWEGNFWNRPRILPVCIWSFKITKFSRFIIILPFSLDVDWRPAKEPNDVNITGDNRLDFKMDISKFRMFDYPFFLKIFDKLPFFEVIFSRVLCL